MVKHFDHVTIVVRDVEAAKQFFGPAATKTSLSLSQARAWGFERRAFTRV